MSSLLNFLNSKKVKDLQRVLEYGKTQEQMDLFDLRDSQFKEIGTPVFFLSTGRCGTAWITKLLESDVELKPFHHPIPVMRSQGKLAYEFNKNQKNLSPSEVVLLNEMFLAGREELFLNCARAGRRVVFTDSRATFFAYQMLEVFPDAKFVHIHRHPGEFVRSGIRRSWYVDKNASELNRIVPLQGDHHYILWEDYSEIEKISWLWMETNTFIENFQAQVEPDNFYTLQFNGWTDKNVSELLSFIGSTVSFKKVEDLLKQKINVQKQKDFPKYQNWSDIDKEQLKTICGSLANKYNYKL